jgi:hypothetical protein
MIKIPQSSGIHLTPKDERRITGISDISPESGGGSLMHAGKVRGQFVLPRGVSQKAHGDEWSARW